jgi:hypothetical protein
MKEDILKFNFFEKIMPIEKEMIEAANSMIETAEAVRIYGETVATAAATAEETAAKTAAEIAVTEVTAAVTAAKWKEAKRILEEEKEKVTTLKNNISTIKQLNKKTAQKTAQEIAEEYKISAKTIRNVIEPDIKKENKLYISLYRQILNYMKKIQSEPSSFLDPLFRNFPKNIQNEIVKILNEKNINIKNINNINHNTISRNVFNIHNNMTLHSKEIYDHYDQLPEILNQDPRYSTVILNDMIQLVEYILQQKEELKTPTLPTFQDFLTTQMNENSFIV